MHHEFTPEAWPEVQHVKIITMIEQLVSNATRQHIELEESRGDTNSPLTSTSGGPKNMRTGTNSNPRLAPTMHAEEVRRNNSELKALKSSKTWVDKNRDVMDAVMEIKRGSFG